MSIAKPKVNPTQKIIHMLSWLVFWACVAGVVYPCHGLYQTYNKGYAAGVKAAAPLVKKVRDEKLRSGSFHKAVQEYKASYGPRPKTKNSPTVHERLYDHAWNAGLDSLLENVPR
ncbi:MAG: hypothetical protein FJX76_18935 [Armatimonadetes bacterium]|nr:hypothetical protein [Armatimonadota bacterium]